MTIGPEANELQDDLSTVVVLSYARYCRYRSLLKRIEAKEDQLLLNDGKQRGQRQRKQQGRQEQIIQDALIELGIPQQRNNRVNILFCRDSFNHEALLNNDLNCDHLAPKLKGRPRKRPLKHKSTTTTTIRASSPESISSEENSRLFSPRRTRRTTAASTLASNRLNNQMKSTSSSTTTSTTTSFYNHRKRTKKTKSKSKNLKRSNNSNSNNNNNCNDNNGKKFDKEDKPGSTNNINNNEGQHENGDNNNNNDNSVDANNNIDKFMEIIMENYTREDINTDYKETFLQKLNEFMNKRETPIQRVPNLGFKKIDLFLFFTRAQKYGGYEKITKERMWKRLYDDMGGDKRSTSAATCTRRHYEKLLLPFERFLRGLPDEFPIKRSNSNNDDNNNNTKNNNNNNDNNNINNDDSDIDGIEDESSNFSEYDSKDNDSDVRVSKSKTETDITKSNDEDPINDSEQEVILKRPMISKEIEEIQNLAELQPSENDAEQITVKEHNSNSNSIVVDLSTTENDIKLIPRDDFVMKEGSLFRDITKQKTNIFDNENIQINVTNDPNNPNGILTNNNKITKNDEDQLEDQHHHQTKRIKLEMNEDKCSVTIIPNNIINLPTINHTSLAKNERLNPSTVLFSNLNSHTKMTALVHPTQRKLKNENDTDVYDFRDFNSAENDREILLPKFKDKNNENENNKSDQSPLHSISNLVNTMSESNNRKVGNKEENEDITKVKFEKISSSRNELLMPSNLLENAFSLPKPFENPKKILMSFKGTPELIKKKNLEPLPAHRSHLFESNFNQREKKFTPQIDEILDLSLKKRCHEADSRTSPSKNIESQSNLEGVLLDLSTKTKQNGNHKSVKSKSELMEHSPIRKDQHIDMNKKTDQQSPPPSSSLSSSSSSSLSTSSLLNQLPSIFSVNKLQKINKHEKIRMPNKSSLNKSGPNPFLKASISEYNPQLPPFIGSHAHYWPNWPPGSFSIYPYSNTLPPNSVSNIPVLPQQFLSSSGSSFSNLDSSITNSLLAPAMLDRFKLLEAYPSPYKNLIEQNSFLNNNNANLGNYRFADLFSSTSK